MREPGIYTSYVGRSGTMLSERSAIETSISFILLPLSPRMASRILFNKELEKVSCWLAANKLSLNVKKSNFLHFHKGNSCKIPLNLILNGTPVEEKETAKYLGTFIDNKLS